MTFEAQILFNSFPFLYIYFIWTVLLWKSFFFKKLHICNSAMALLTVTACVLCGTVSLFFLFVFIAQFKAIVPSREPYVPPVRRHMTTVCTLWFTTLLQGSRNISLSCPLISFTHWSVLNEIITFSTVTNALLEAVLFLSLFKLSSPKWSCRSSTDQFL